MRFRIPSRPMAAGLAGLSLLLGGLSFSASQTAAPPSSPCQDCHEKVTPGIVTQFRKGKMGQMGIDCAVCHGSEHTGPQDAQKARMPTPDTCQSCHPNRVEQFRAGKHAQAWHAMALMPLLGHQPRAVVGADGFKGCSGCHKVGEKTPEELKAGDFRYGTASCDSCHTRHTFSVAEARSPRACQTCHMGFDHPQWEMWSTSKHGTVFEVEGNTGRAPRCQTCHMPDGDHAVITSWGFYALRLPEDDPQWKADREVILTALGLLDGKGAPTPRSKLASSVNLFRQTKADFQAHRTKLQGICGKCHSPSFVKQHFSSSETIIREVDRIMAGAIRTVRGLYADGILKKPQGWEHAPDILQAYEAKSSVEQNLYVMFKEYRNRAFQGAFHANPDYMHWYGWAPLKKAAREIEDEAARLRALAAAR